MAFLIIDTLFANELAGFRSGNNLTVAHLRGEILIHCFEYDAYETSFQRCAANMLSGGNWSKFYYDADIDADKVELIATWENGKIVKKSSAFNRLHKESSSSFNLWVWTLLQRPLLDAGNNNIHYRLLKNNVLMAEGDFVVSINQEESRQCRFRVYNSSNNMDCINSTFICDRYFWEENYCK